MAEVKHNFEEFRMGNPFYPKCKYHRELPACLVYDDREEKALGPEWWDDPGFTRQPDCVVSKVTLQEPLPERTMAVAVPIPEDPKPDKRFRK